MKKLNRGDTLLIATHNSGKLKELQELLLPYGVKAISAGELNLPEPEETALTFEGNALIKAKAAAEASGFIALSDDSGLCVEALGGEPGVFSARWGGENKDFVGAMNKVEALLQEKGALLTAQRQAEFVCALCLYSPSGEHVVIEERIKGEIVQQRGSQGFGYDAFFLPKGETRTFGEMSASEKHGLPPLGLGLSHRAKAFLRLKEKYLPELLP